MRYLMSVVVAALLLTCQPGAEDASSADPPMQKGLVVHEWGVLSTYNDIELANADARATWADLPKFIYGQVDQRKVPQELLIVDVPVLYFYSPKVVQLRVRVDFPGGRPAVWWPGNANTGRQVDQKLADNFLIWQLQVMPLDSKEGAMAPMPKGHWLESLRAVKSCQVRAVNGIDLGVSERFVYYDGLIPAPRALKVAVTGEKVSLQSQAKHPLLDVTVIDLRNLRKIRVARLPKLEAEAEGTEVEFKEADQTKWPADAVATLLDQLKSAGLNEDEAKTLTEVWKKDFFETEGLNVFYRLPQEEYDRLLPLKIVPTPEKTARVLLVHHPHCEPDLGAHVLMLVAQLESTKFEERLEAQKRLTALGQAAFVHLVRARKETNDPEMRSRLNKLLEEFEAERGFAK